MIMRGTECLEIFRDNIERDELVDRLEALLLNLNELLCPVIIIQTCPFSVLYMDIITADANESPAQRPYSYKYGQA